METNSDANPAPDNSPPESKSEGVELAPAIEFDQFIAVDMRAATILSAEKHPKADRLLVLQIDLGFEQRTVCAGVAAAYTPEELVGRRVVAVANLSPRKLRGIESQGMLLATEDEAGLPRFVAPGEGTPNGARVT
jgi:methionyl-tRNA synthetase